MKYNWQHPDWPNFKFDVSKHQELIREINLKIGEQTGSLKFLSVDEQLNITTEQLVIESLKTSAIEGEYFSREDIYSSIQVNLGLREKEGIINSKEANGVAKLIFESRHHFKKRLTHNLLFDWHRLIFPNSSKLLIGAYRKGENPMQIISGSTYNYTVHFEAPSSQVISNEMTRFLIWLNKQTIYKSDVKNNIGVTAAIAHLYFESIHPFQDGNGRIGRAIAEKVLFQTIGFPVLISLSSIIDQNKNNYYQALKQGQRSLEIDTWIHYFLSLILEALNKTQQIISFTILKSALFESAKGRINERQLRVLKKMTQSPLEPFEGGINAKKYMSITKTSKATATRDLQSLLALGILKKIGDGRSTRYEIILEQQFQN